MSRELLEAIRPRKKLRVMDLVHAAGIDDSDWTNFKGPNPSTNPKYCYEWAFVDGERVVVLNLWFDSMEVDGSGIIFQRLNFQNLATKLESEGRHSNWSRRARRLDLAFQAAAKLRLPVRVIVNDGNRRDTERDPDKASQVKRRILDDQVWSVAEYKWETGDCLLVRGIDPRKFLDQFSLLDFGAAPDKGRSEQAFVCIV
ncbi:MAG: hypothetical protein ABIR62_10895 [Dokdonella sp.]|uniref:hypothetical protein n=1 Tax=Dokdonella sp. TaxID=2291710 RepID=UPI003265CAC3